MIVVGIDPGLRGAIALLDGDTVRLWDMPVREHKGKNRIEEHVLAELLGLHAFGDYCGPGDGIAFIELAQATPQMGVSSAFNYGVGFGLVRGVLAHLRVPMRLVPANVWKRHMGLITPGSRTIGRDEARDKKTPLKLARKLYPQLGEQLALEKHEGRAEAILIAHYGCEQLDDGAVDHGAA